jgi:GTP pyrophosphokinase
MIIKKAKEFAEKYHKGQYRNSYDEQGNRIEYFIHPQTVAETVAEIVKKVENSDKIKELVAASYLHDTVQDTELTYEDIKREFGDLVASIVQELTNDSEQIKLIGKEKYLTQRVLEISNWALVIKLADRLNNVEDLKKKYNSNNSSDRKWAIKYSNQTRSIINTLKKYRNLSQTQKQLISEIEDRLL